MFEFILLMDVIDIPYITELHIVVGAIILILAYYNYSIISKTEAPARIKRILRTMASLATAQPILGFLIYLDFSLKYSICSSGIIGIVHLIISLAIITQAASVATSYDMWEEKEFIQARKPPELEVKKEIT